MKKIKIRTVGASHWIECFFVISESEAAIHIDNRREGPFHCSATLVKLPNGNLANSAGQEFEILDSEPLTACCGETAHACDCDGGPQWR